MEESGFQRHFLRSLKFHWMHNKFSLAFYVTRARLTWKLKEAFRTRRNRFRFFSPLLKRSGISRSDNGRERQRWTASSRGTVREIRPTSKDHDYNLRLHRSTGSPADSTCLGYGVPPNSRSCLQTTRDNGASRTKSVCVTRQKVNFDAEELRTYNFRLFHKSGQ